MIPSIPGIKVDIEGQRCLQSIVANLFHSKTPSKFPGAQPISFAAAHFDELENENYFVSEKADGIRVLLFCHYDVQERSPKTYLIDRKNNYYLQSNLWLPFHQDTSKPLYDTIIDSELVIDQDQQKGNILCLLFFDLAVYMGKNLTERPYTTRLGYLKENVLKPFKKVLASIPDYKNKLPFFMGLKKLELSYGLAKLFEDMGKLQHKSDGIIFTSSIAPYTLGTCHKMLKWKPSEENTVDFKITKKGEDYWLSLWLGGRDYKEHSKLTLDSNESTEWKKDSVDGRIAECRYDPSWPDFWRFMRWRDDKENGNHISTYEKIMQSISDNVEKQELIDRSAIIRTKWKIRNKEPL